MKRFLALTMTGIMLLSSNVLGATDIFYNDEQIAYTDQTPVIINDRTYVPIRDVFEKLGYTVAWDDITRTVHIYNDYYDIFVNTQTNYYLGYDLTLDVNCFELTDKIQVVNDRTMLPLRQILEAMNYNLEWNADSKSSVITDGNDYKKMEEEYDEIADARKKINNLSFVADETKEIGSFTEEEINFISVINNVKHQELEDDLHMINNTPCPKELEKFKEAYITALKNHRDYLSESAECIINTMGMDNAVDQVGITADIVEINRFNSSRKWDWEVSVPFNLLMEYAKEKNVSFGIASSEN